MLWLIKVRLLLSHGADPNCREGKGPTALSYSVDGPLGIFTLLARGAANLNLKYYDNDVVKSIALRNRLEELTGKKQSEGRTILQSMAVAGKIDHVKVLIESGANAFIVDHEGKTALALAQHAFDVLNSDKYLRESKPNNLGPFSGERKVDHDASLSKWRKTDNLRNVIEYLTGL